MPGSDGEGGGRVSVLERSLPLTVLVVDDHPTAREAMHAIVAAVPDARVLVLPAAGAPADVADLLDAVRRARAVEDRPATDCPRLTGRETEVLRLVVTGLTSRQVASRLVLSRRTVENHVQRVMAKLQLHNRVELVRYAIATGLG